MAVPEQLVYVGPSLQNGRLTQYTVFKDGLPAHLSDLLEIEPAVRDLIVPVGKLTATQSLVQEQGTLEHAAYERLKKGV